MNKFYSLILATASAIVLPVSGAAGTLLTSSTKSAKELSVSNQHKITSLGSSMANAKMLNFASKPLNLQKSKSNRTATSSGDPVMLAGEPITDVEGSIQNYILSFTTYSIYYSEYDATGLKFDICIDADGSTVYIRTLLPGYNKADDDSPSSWVEGTLDGNTITIPAGQQLCTYYNGAVVLCMEFGKASDSTKARLKATAKAQSSYYDDDYDDDDWSWDDIWNDLWGGDENEDIDNLVYQTEFKMTLGDDGSISVADECADWYVVAYGFSDDDDYAGIYSYGYNYEFQPYGDNISFVSLPDDVTIAKYTLKSTADDDRTVNVAFGNNNDIYFQGMVEYYANDWTKGTINGNIVTVEAGQYYNSDDYYLGMLGIGHLTAEGDGWYTDNKYDYIDKAEFTISDDKSEILYVDEDIYFLDLDPTCDYVYGGDGDYCFYAKPVAKPAVPATPSISFGNYNGYDYLLCDIPTTDVDGTELDTDYLTYSLLFDDVLVTFSPDVYYGLDEDMTEIPYSFEDDEYDFQVYSTYHYVFIYDTSWENAGVFSTYTVDGVVNHSETAYLYETGIENVNADANVAPKFYNLQGIELPANNLPKGIVLVKQGNSVRKVVVK
jgi:hypothetical protein